MLHIRFRMKTIKCNYADDHIIVGIFADKLTE